MTPFVFKRIIQALFIVWGVLTLTFATVQLAPGDPAAIYIRPDIDPQTVAHIRREMGLDRPLGQQYLLWMGQVVRGNFGVSFINHRPVNEVLLEAIPNTLRLTLVVFIFQFWVGILLGMAMSRRQNSRLSRLLDTVLLILYSIPGFWLALMLILIFSLKLGWLPSSQMASLTPAREEWGQWIDQVRHLVLPTLVLGAALVAYTARFVRDKMSGILDSEYIRTARAYGLSRNKIFYKYALKNALLPLATMVGLYLPFLLGGAVVIEYVFAWPGMGRVTINAIFAHDYPVMMASCCIAAMAVVIGNLISDLLYQLVDPRINFGDLG